jgi:glycerophosphoryl diester phosphodiesterase
MSLVMAVTVLCAGVLPAYAAVEDFAHANILTPNIVGAPTVIARVSSLAEIDALIAGKIATSVMIDLDSMDAVPAILAKTRGQLIPIFVLTDKNVARQLADYFVTHETGDTHIASADDALIKEFRAISPLSRASLIYASDTLTLKDAYELVKRSNACFSKNVVIDVACADKEIVEKIQRLITTVWVMSDDTLVGNHRSITSGATGIVCRDVALLKSCADLYTTKTLTRRVFAVGHRGTPGGSGAAFNAPENTMAGWRMAHDEFGADIIETDVYVTKDGHLINLHDDTFVRTTDILTTTLITDEEVAATGKSRNTLTPRDLTLEQIRRLDAGSKLGGEKFAGEKIPTLEELLEYVKANDLVLFLESKDNLNPRDLVEPATINVVASFGEEMFDQVTIISFNVNSLALYKDISPWVSLGHLNTATASADLNNPPAALDKILKVIQPLNNSYNATASALNKTIIEECVARGISLWPWTFTSQTTQKNYIDYGITGFTTNYANWTKDTVMSIAPDAYHYAVKVGQSVGIGSKTLTNLKVDKQLPAEIVVLEGGDCIETDGSQVKGLKDGTATIMLRTQSDATDGCNSYTLYSQPITVQVGSQLLLTTDAHLVKKGDYFRLYPAFDETVNSNASILTLRFDADKFEYRGFTPAQGVTLVHTEATDGQLTMTFMAPDYRTKNYGELLFSAKEDAGLQTGDNVIRAVAKLAVKAADGSKSIVNVEASVSFTTSGGVPGDTTGKGYVDLIDLSNVIDLFGVTADDPRWSAARFYDFNGSGAIDIQDIAAVAVLIA